MKSLKLFFMSDKEIKILAPIKGRLVGVDKVTM